MKINGIEYGNGIALEVKKDTDLPKTDIEISNQNNTITFGVKESLVGGGGGKSVKEILIYDDYQDWSVGGIAADSDDFITDPVLETDHNFQGMVFVTTLTYTLFNGNIQSESHICMLGDTINSSAGGNTMRYYSDSGPYNKPTFLMRSGSSTQTSGNALIGIRFSDEPYMSDTTKPIKITIYRWALA